MTNSNQTTEGAATLPMEPPAPVIDTKNKSESQDEGQEDKKFTWLEIAVLALVVSSVALWAALFLGYPSKRNLGAFGAVDIEHTLNLAMMVQTAKLTDAKTEEEKEQIKKNVEGIGKRLEDAMERIQGECKCALLIKQAVVTGMKDYTPELQKLMGVYGIDESKLSGAIASQLANKFGMAPTTASTASAVTGK